MIEIIEDYLDHLCAPLVGIVPYAKRLQLRQEAASNIEDRMKTYVIDGIEPTGAALKAVEQYGDTSEISEQFLEEWTRYLPKGFIAQRIGLPLSYAVVFFTQASLWGILIIFSRLYWFLPQPESFGIPPGRLRELIPDPFPLPDKSPVWMLLWAYVLLAPIVAGLFVGRSVYIGAARAVIIVLIPLIVLSFMVGTFMLPIKDGLWYALMQMVWWVPIGSVAAHVASVLARRKRFQFKTSMEK